MLSNEQKMMAFIILEFFQAVTLKEFPALIVMLCYQYFFSTILAAMFSLTVVTELSAWKLRLDVGLFAIAYSVSIWIPLPSISVPELYIEFGSEQLFIYLRLKFCYEWSNKQMHYIILTNCT